MTFIAAPPRPPDRRLRTADAAAVFLGLRQTERAFQQHVVTYARLMGWNCYFTHDSRHSPAGWPDLVLTRRPRILFAELKSQRGRLTAEQRECLAELRACGMDVRVWRPSMWPEIERCLR